MALNRNEKQILLNVLTIFKDKLDISELSKDEETELRNLLEIVKPMVKNEIAKKENMTVTLADYRKDLLAKVNHALDTYGVNKTLKLTNIGKETYVRIRNNSDSLRIETILDVLERIKKSESQLKKLIAV